jgi:predicted amidohydrolase
MQLLDTICLFLTQDRKSEKRRTLTIHAMPRILKVAAAQVGAVHRWTPREETLHRLVALLEKAVALGAQLVVYPETTLTTFFPRYLIEDETELNSYYEVGENITDNPAISPLFTRSRELRVDIYIGYAEKDASGARFNTSIYYSGTLGVVLSKYRKSHLPGTAEPFTEPDAVQQLEKRYFREGDTGFKAFRVPELLVESKNDSQEGQLLPATDGKGDPIMGMLICNDRRWPEAWRVYGLQGAEIILCGYNSPAWAPQLWGFGNERPLTPERARKDAEFQHKLVMQSNSYMNSCFSVCAARAGNDDNMYPLIGGSCIVDPFGYVLADAATEEDEIVFAEIDLDQCIPGKQTVSAPYAFDSCPVF